LTYNSNLNINLTSVGFSANESQIYLALLELGKGTVSQITRNAGINRTTGYEVLNNLVAKGLVTISGKKPRQEYAAESPDKLQRYFDEQMQRNQQYSITVANLVPQLKSLHNVADRPQVRFYEGKEGLVQVYEDTLTSHEPIRAYASVEDTQHTLPDYFPKYYKRRAAKGIKIRAIFPKTPEAQELVKHDGEEMRETALVPSKEYSFTPEVNIYDNKVMIASWKEKLGIVIESGEIADMMKKIFELAWAEAKRLESGLGEEGK
jgi:HTH-type transcriptional regulator, sugar sensing transcriptional regulator